MGTQLLTPLNEASVTGLIVIGVMIVIDVLTGVFKSVKAGDFSSGGLRQGLFHKFTWLVALVVAYIIDAAQVHMDLGITVPILLPTSLYITLSEIASVLENLSEINPEMKKLKLFTIFSHVDPAAVPETKPVEIAETLTSTDTASEKTEVTA